MNKAEFEAWKQHTESSKRDWTLDPVHNGQNGQDYLFHRGGVNGQFIMVSLGLAKIGNYEGALPHIGEASFQILHSNEYGSDNDAFLALMHKGGFGFLKDFVTVDESGLF